MFNASNLELEQYQDSNGLFPASPNSENPEMRNFWIRDNYYIYLAVNKDVKKKMVLAFQKIIDYLQELKKFNCKPTEDWMYVHPRYDKNLKEIPGNWGWLQNDATGNLLEILSEARDSKRTKLIVNYLDAIEYWKCKDYGFWEEWPKELRSSSLAACVRGLDACLKNIKDDSQVKELINNGYNSLFSILPNETESRKHDLALLSLIYPKQIVSNPMKEQIIKRVQSLEGHWGIKRYFGDTWNGKSNSLGLGREMQWNFLSWLYLCTGNKLDFLRAKENLEKFGACEGVVEGEKNCTSNLLWVLAMYKLAEKKFKEEL